MHVIFVEPSFPGYQRNFVRGLKEAGAYVTGIGERPYAWLDDETKSWLGAYEQVGSVCNEAEMIAAVKRIQARGWVDRLEATIEAHILPVARVREATGIPGMTERAAFICRDKPTMKEVLRRQGVPCAQSAAVDSPAEARAFAQAVGFPLIFKPRAGAGADGTVRVDDVRGLEAAIISSGLADGRSVAIEEFIEGHEGFYDTMSIKGEPAVEFISHYYPSVLIAMRSRDVSPVIISTNRVEAAGYAEVRELGRKVIKALGLETVPTHMEWFYGPKGLKFSEIGARPPGVKQWDLYCAGNDMDVYRQWAMAICHGRLDQRPSRRMAAGIVNLRPNRDGRIQGYSGVEEVERTLGGYLMDMHLPRVGTGTQPVEAGYNANAYVRLRHPDYDTCRELLFWVGRTLKVHAG